MVMPFGGPGIIPSTRGVPSACFSMGAGETYLIPAGSWAISTGLYASLQRFDPVTGIWRQAGSFGAGMSYVISDGVNYRIANQTGCAIGALLTNAGSGYTSAPTVAASAGNSVWQAVYGSVISTTVTVNTGGSNYLYPPIVIIGSPSFPGIQATGYSTISGGVVTGITIANQGGGYTALPSISLYNDPRDTTGGGATATIALTGSGTVNGVVCTDHGNAVTAVPTLTFSGGGGTSAAATAIMDFALTGYTVGTAGAGFANNLQIWGIPALTAGSAAYTNPQSQTGLLAMRQGSIIGAISGGGITATGLVLLDGGHYETVPSLVYASNSVVTTAGVLTATVGGQRSDIIMLAI